MAFYTSIAAAYDRIFPFDEDLVPFLLQFQYPGRRGLDIGCATGYLANALARREFEITGIDLDAEMIRLARVRFQNSRVSFFVRDMTRLAQGFPPESFDLVTCFGNTLVHLPDAAAIGRTLKQVFDLLTDEGGFIGQIIQYDRILSRRPTGLPTIERDGILFERTYSYDSDDSRIRFSTRLTGVDIPYPIENEIPLFPLRTEELRQCLIEAGFAPPVFFADTDNSPLTDDSYALYFVAEKPARPQEQPQTPPQEPPPEVS
jgi:SAM-dependent methyltransferase